MSPDRLQIDSFCAMLCKRGLLMEGRREDRAQVMLEADFEAHHNRDPYFSDDRISRARFSRAVPLLDGSVTYYIEDQVYDLCPGDLLCHPAGADAPAGHRERACGVRAHGAVGGARLHRADRRRGGRVAGGAARRRAERLLRPVSGRRPDFRGNAVQAHRGDAPAAARTVCLRLRRSASTCAAFSRRTVLSRSRRRGKRR